MNRLSRIAAIRADVPSSFAIPWYLSVSNISLKSASVPLWEGSGSLRARASVLNGLSLWIGVAPGLCATFTFESLGSVFLMVASLAEGL